MNYLIVGCCALLSSFFLASFSVKEIEKETAYNYNNKIYVYIINLLLWTTLYYFYGMSWDMLIMCLVASALLGLSVVDFAIYEIPIEFNYWILLLGIVHLILHIHDWLEYAIGFVLVSGLFLIISLATKGKGMGGGDIKLMATLGLVLGWKKIVLVMIIGSLLGALIHGLIMAIRKKEHLLAFGPYLSCAGIIIMCYGDQIINWYISQFLTFSIE